MSSRAAAKLIGHTNYHGLNIGTKVRMPWTRYKRQRMTLEAQVDLHVLLDDRQPLGYESAAAVNAPRQIKKTDQET